MDNAATNTRRRSDNTRTMAGDIMIKSILLGSTVLAIACATAAPASAQNLRLSNTTAPTTALTLEQIENLPTQLGVIEALRNLTPQPWQDRNPPAVSIRGIADNGLVYGFRLRDDGPKPSDVETVTVLQNAQGPFFGIAAGGAIGISTNVRSSNFGSDGRVDLGNSLMLHAQAGFTVYPGVSAALAWQYRPGFDFDYLSGTERVRADITNNNVMVNFRVAPLVAFPQLAGNRGVLFPLQPAIELGLGVAINRVGGATVTDSVSGAPLGTISGRTRTDFAWSIGGNLTYDIGRATAIRGLSASLGWRYVDMGSLRGGSSFTSSGGSTSTIDPIAADLRSHDIYLRLTYRFGAPPPP